MNSSASYAEKITKMANKGNSNDGPEETYKKVSKSRQGSLIGSLNIIGPCCTHSIASSLTDLWGASSNARYCYRKFCPFPVCHTT